MATKQEPIRRNDVIRCEKCGEDYSVTYKRCPFCDERPPRTRKVNGGTTGSGRRVAGGAPAAQKRGVNPLQVIGVVGSLILIIAALYIVFTVVSPLLGLGGGTDNPSPSQPSKPSQSTIHTPPSGGTTQPSGSTTTPDPEPVPEVKDPVVAHVNSLKLNKSDFTLGRNESWKIKATVDPADTPVIWTSSDESAAKVAQDGTVYNVNTGSGMKNVTITATAGDKSATCIVRCKGGSSGLNFPSDYAPGTVPAGTPSTPATPSTPTTPTTPTTPSAPSTTPSTPSTPSSGTAMNATGTITGARNGLNVRSGPGSSYDAIASLSNGASIKILQDTGAGWYKISFSGINGKATEGYVSKDYVTVG